MTIIVALLFVFLAGPVSAGELVRYRTADGAVGFVDDERRLPVDAIIVSRTPLTQPPAAAKPPIQEPAEGSEAVELADAGAGEVRDCAAHAERSAQLACWRDRGNECSRFGLPLRCAPEELAAAASWCDRGVSLRSERTPIEDQLAAAIENHRACKNSSRPGTSCSREEVLEAERAAEVWDLRLAALEEQCHDQGCMPGWVRESCEEPAPR